jgi:hypothetical protein
MFKIDHDFVLTVCCATSEETLAASELPFRFNPTVARAETVFQQRDKNSDNKIDWSEPSANDAESRHPALRQLLAVFDSDGDQLLLLTEVQGAPRLLPARCPNRFRSDAG